MTNFNINAADLTAGDFTNAGFDRRKEAAVAHIVRVNAETERWCWKAIAQGVGNRVWRSESIHEPWPSTIIRYQFAILQPGEPAPGPGVIKGPFSSEDMQ